MFGWQLLVDCCLFVWVVLYSIRLFDFVAGVCVDCDYVPVWFGYMLVGGACLSASVIGLCCYLLISLTGFGDLIVLLYCDAIYRCLCYRLFLGVVYLCVWLLGVLWLLMLVVCFVWCFELILYCLLLLVMCYI